LIEPHGRKKQKPIQAVGIMVLPTPLLVPGEVGECGQRTRSPGEDSLMTRAVDPRGFHTCERAGCGAIRPMPKPSYGPVCAMQASTAANFGGNFRLENSSLTFAARDADS
jgi:hypothetical protein